MNARSYEGPGAAVARRLFRRMKTGSSWTRDASAFRSFLGATAGHEVSYLNLTVDLELAWAVARRGSGSISPALLRERARRARSNLPVLLSLCDRYRVPLTVATVAHLALGACTHRQPPRFVPSWMGTDWYHVDPGEGLASLPDYCGTDLVQDVLERSTVHELASHTFTHVDLADPETPFEVALFELTESFAVLSGLYPGLTTLVFPKNHPAYLSLVREAGYTVYRGGANAGLECDVHGLWRFPLGLWLSPMALSPSQAIEITLEAIRRKQLVNFYLHLYEYQSARALERHIEPFFAVLAREQERGTVVVDTMAQVIDALQPKPPSLQMNSAPLAP